MGMGRAEGLPTLGLYVLVFLCAGSIRYKRSYILPLCLASTGFSAVALLQFMDKNPLGLYPGEYYYYAAQDVYTARFVSTIGNEGIACAFMCAALPFMLAYFVTAKNKRSYLTLPVMALMFFVLLYTGVLGGSHIVYPKDTASEGYLMTDNMDDRARQLAVYMIDTGSTVRAAAKYFGISKSTVHKDLCQRTAT